MVATVCLGCAGKSDRSYSGIEPHKEGFHSGQGAENGGIL